MERREEKKVGGTGQSTRTRGVTRKRSGLKGDRRVSVMGYLER